MKKGKLLFLIAFLAFCGLVIAFVCRTNHDSPATSSPTEDVSQFVTLTDAVPDAILEIRYFSTYNFVAAASMVIWSRRRR